MQINTILDRADVASKIFNLASQLAQKIMLLATARIFLRKLGQHTKPSLTQIYRR